MEGASERKKRWRRGDACAPNSGGTSRNEMHGNIHVYIQEHERRRKKKKERKRERKRVGGGREGRQRKGEKVRKGVPEGEILTLEMRELPRVCGVRNFLAIYRRRCGRRVRVRGERGVKGDAKRER